MRKYDIVNRLAKQHGFRTCLELCTTTTGGAYAEIDRTQLTSTQRLMYRCPDDFDDGLDCAFRTSGPSSHELVRAIFYACAGQPRFDIVFVDPFHTYTASTTDLLGAYCLARPGGVIVVHDCGPTDPNIVSPDCNPGSWCGVTYQAFIDFTLPRCQIRSYTVDCDFGCGVIYKPEGASSEDCMLELEWSLARNNEAMRFRHFMQNRAALLRLITEDEFLAVAGLSETIVDPAAVVETRLHATLDAPPSADSEAAELCTVVVAGS